LGKGPAINRDHYTPKEHGKNRFECFSCALHAFYFLSVYESQKKDNGRLFHDQIILYGFNPFDALYDFTRFIDGLLRINESAQLNGALTSFGTYLK
jgi:hypothetical protein